MLIFLICHIWRWMHLPWRLIISKLENLKVHIARESSDPEKRSRETTVEIFEPRRTCEIATFSDRKCHGRSAVLKFRHNNSHKIKSGNGANRIMQDFDRSSHRATPSDPNAAFRTADMFVYFLIFFFFLRKHDADTTTTVNIIESRWAIGRDEFRAALVSRLTGFARDTCWSTPAPRSWLSRLDQL